MSEGVAVYWLLRHQNALVVLDPAGDGDFPRSQREDLPPLRNVLPVGEWRGRACLAAELDELPAQWVDCLVPLRQVFTVMGMAAFMLAGRGVQLLDWQHNHRFCGACATRTQKNVGELAMRCPACGLLAYPRLSPAVMVLVTRGDELLLARSPRFPPGVFSALAGFVEPGETFEQCAAREVREEVGLEIANLRYFGSQPWPFPNSLMVAFIADYAGGNLNPDGVEIEMAEWFSAEALPTLPVPMSIAHRLIGHWLAGKLISSP